jgi:hypothetical protein
MPCKINGIFFWTSPRFGGIVRASRVTRRNPNRPMKTQTEIRRAFWSNHPELDKLARERGTRSKRQNSQPTDIRVAFVDWVDSLAKDGQISAELAHNVTL